MRFDQSVGRLLIMLLVGFGAVMAAATYWAVAGPETALREPVNYRLRDAAGTLIRGSIADRDGRLMVVSVASEDDGYVTRRVASPALYSLTGYSSLRYGVAGAEAAFDPILRGVDIVRDFEDTIRHDLLHLPRRGSDVRLTIALDVQEAAAAALESFGQPGGIVVMEASTGELLAIASTPAVDPETLDARWAELVADPARPFINRATQSAYTIGSAISPALLAAWLIDGRGVNDELPPEAVVDCPDMDGRTVREAFTRHCIPAFDAMTEILGPVKIEAMIDLFGMHQTVVLEGFTRPAGAPADLEPGTETTSQATSTLAEPGSITRSPLELAVMTASIAAGGNAPKPVLLRATRAPDGEWVAADGGGQLMAVTTAQTASTVANAMRSSSDTGLARSDVCVGTDVGAVVGMSTRDDMTQAYFTGFAQLVDGHTVVVALAIENVDLSQAADLAAAGKGVLCAALAAYAEG